MRHYPEGAETGLPEAMFLAGVYLDQGKGMAASDYPAAAVWYRRAADEGHGPAAFNLCHMYNTGRGRVVIENKHSADVESPPPPPPYTPRVCMSIHPEGSR